MRLLRQLKSQENCDLYDVLAEIGYGISPKTRQERVFALEYKHSGWLNSLPDATRTALLALARQFQKGGTEELENPYVFTSPEVRRAGGLEALRIIGEPVDIISEAKRRLFAA